MQRNIVVEVFSLDPEKVVNPVQGNGDYLDEYTGYDVKEFKESNVNYRQIGIRDRRNGDCFNLYGWKLVTGEKIWTWEDRNDGIRSWELPHDHISVFTVNEHNEKVYLW